MMYHLPVMPEESVKLLNIVPGGTYVDVTFGGGGHSVKILEQLEQGRLIAFDQDPDAAKNRINDARFMFINQNFRYLENYLGFYQCIPVDGIFADLGVSSYQIDEPTRGFSYMFPDETLDMRMNSGSRMMASDILNGYTEQDLATVMFKYGELPFSRKLARAVVSRRSEQRLKKVSDLTDLIDRFVGPGKKFSIYSRVFQALRIEVNEEIKVLEELLEQALRVLKPGGRIVVISYHSLEDRLVKNFLRSGKSDGIIEKDFYGNKKLVFRVLTSKPITAAPHEIDSNPRARSAKLRAAEKL